jgi:hypothetical protein
MPVFATDSSENSALERSMGAVPTGSQSEPIDSGATSIPSDHQTNSKPGMNIALMFNSVR